MEEPLAPTAAAPSSSEYVAAPGGAEAAADATAAELDALLAAADDDEDVAMLLLDEGEEEGEGDDAAVGYGEASAADDSGALGQSGVHGTAISTYAERPVRDERVARSRAQRELTELSEAEKAAEHAVLVSREKEDEEKRRLGELPGEAAHAEQTLGRLRAEGERKPNRGAQQAAAKRLDAIGAAIDAQSGIVGEATLAARRAQSELDGLQLARASAAKSIGALESNAAGEHRAHSLAAPARIAQEREAAEREVAALRQKDAAVEAAAAARSEVARKQLRAARDGHRKAIAKVRERCARRPPDRPPARPSSPSHSSHRPPSPAAARTWRRS